ncbi:MAG: RidA family protein [Myxococcota bacterium]
MSTIRRINAPDLGRLRAFSHASIAGDFIYVSGTLGTREGSFELTEGGTGPQTAQTLANLRRALNAAGADLEDVVKVNVFLVDMGTFAEMNAAYLEVFPSEPPARITVGCSALALGAAVEIDCVAYKPGVGG